MNMTEKDFINIVKNVLDESIVRIVREEINKRIPSGTRFYRVIDDTGEIVSYYPYVDTHVKHQDI